MSREELCTEAEITTLVHQFYARVREDALIGPVFDAHVHDWDSHLATMVRFWSSVLRGSGTYRGTPMPKHVALPGLNPDMFQRWLALFHETTETLPNRPFAESAETAAQRIARSLWYGYQMSRDPERMPSELFNG
ncbi:group III truncated hemoglobin [Allopusillimonas soli]|uniref:Group III truncated hemoglobin n=1 Tax=Allopusillimonas soli TaxID=659016 RepID=A0A853F7A1_9BURK|nr:group III truncated hemoglobin [Allopusillimonas soli]NYT35698.1 group III truncated hemoglobin [Allopusillimonas soli]TEA76089.1 group III truncated hemoglobin [Allopusillimonas soli]